MRILKRISIAGLLIGLLLLHFAFTFGADNNWCPVQLPFPGAGYTASYPFHIANGGNFKIQVSSPMETEKGKGGLPAIPPIVCDMRLIITGDHACKVERNITHFRRSGRSDSWGLDYFTSEPLNIPRKGDYVLEVSNKTNVDQFSRTGAMISLTRYEHPVESTLRYWILDKMSYPLIILSLTTLLFSTRQKKLQPVTP